MSSAQEVLDAFKDNGGLPLYLNMNDACVFRLIAFFSAF